MPQKGQIQQHEWKGPYNTNSSYCFCSSCKCKMKFEYGQWYYMPVGKSDWQAKEPACITRQLKQHESNSK